jgi:hypothetical protein
MKESGSLFVNEWKNVIYKVIIEYGGDKQFFIHKFKKKAHFQYQHIPFNKRAGKYAHQEV